MPFTNFFYHVMLCPLQVDCKPRGIVLRTPSACSSIEKKIHACRSHKWISEQFTMHEDCLEEAILKIKKAIKSCLIAPKPNRFLFISHSALEMRYVSSISFINTSYNNPNKKFFLTCLQCVRLMSAPAPGSCKGGWP